MTQMLWNGRPLHVLVSLRLRCVNTPYGIVNRDEPPSLCSMLVGLICAASDGGMNVEARRGLNKADCSRKRLVNLCALGMLKYRVKPTILMR